MADFSTSLSSGASAAMNALDLSQRGSGDNKLAGAAKDFEALLIAQMLKSMHDEGGWLGTGDDEAGEAAIELGEEQLARSMAASGGLGLSNLIESGIRNQEGAEDTDSAIPGKGKRQPLKATAHANAISRAGCSSQCSMSPVE